jgi:hypothetical protein
MEFDVPFDQNYYTKKNKLRWWLASKREMRTSLILFSLGVIGLLYTYVSSPNIDLVSLFSNALLGAFVLNLFLNYLKYRKGLSVIAQNARLESKLKINSKKVPEWEFGEDYFRYQDSEMDYKLSWRSMKGYFLHSGHIFILQSGGLMDAIIISEEQLGSEKFDKIVEFVKLKLRPSI